MKLICYLSNGYPSLEATARLADAYVESGCDIIEIDFPAKNPYLEGEYIKNRMIDALALNANYPMYMETLATIVQKHAKTQFIVLVYEQTIIDIGVEQFIDFCLNHQLMNIIYVGHDHLKVRHSLQSKGLKVASYIRFHLPKEDIESARATNGFIYLQAKPGEINPEYPTLKACIQHLRNDLGFNKTIYCGVGIATPEDVSMAKEAGAEGVFVGSVLLKLQDQLDVMKQTITSLKSHAE